MDRVRLSGELYLVMDRTCVTDPPMYSIEAGSLIGGEP